MQKFLVTVRLILLGVLLTTLAQAVQATEIIVQGLYRDGAIVLIDGVQRTMKAGKRSPEGVLLISATNKEGVFEIDGKRQTLTVRRGAISTGFQAAEKAEVRIAAGEGGHYFTPARINGLAAVVLVDTGATTVVMNRGTAKKLNISTVNAVPVQMGTANGVAVAYSVMLNSVRVGAVEVRNVEGLVSDNEFPEMILLGNSFLSRLNMRNESGVLVLESRL